MQTRYYNYLADDDTDSLNRRQMGLIDKGVYRGFDTDLAAGGLTLQLIHSQTGLEEVKGDGTVLSNLGLLVTGQGVIIKEDGNINVPIAANTASDERIDVVVCTHTYIFTEGGTTAIYEVIQGTAGAGVPALTDAIHQTIIGKLTMPAGATALSATGVKWRKAIAPMFAGNPRIITEFEAVITSEYTVSFEQDKLIFFSTTSSGTAVIHFDFEDAVKGSVIRLKWTFGAGSALIFDTPSDAVLFRDGGSLSSVSSSTNLLYMIYCGLNEAGLHEVSYTLKQV